MEQANLLRNLDRLFEKKEQDDRHFKEYVECMISFAKIDTLGIKDKDNIYNKLKPYIGKVTEEINSMYHVPLVSDKVYPEEELKLDSLSLAIYILSTQTQALINIGDNNLYLPQPCSFINSEGKTVSLG